MKRAPGSKSWRRRGICPRGRSSSSSRCSWPSPRSRRRSRRCEIRPLPWRPTWPTVSPASRCRSFDAGDASPTSEVAAGSPASCSRRRSRARRSASSRAPGGSARSSARPRRGPGSRTSTWSTRARRSGAPASGRRTSSRRARSRPPPSWPSTPHRCSSRAGCSSPGRGAAMPTRSATPPRRRRSSASTSRRPCAVAPRPGADARHLVVLRKVAPTPAGYPRRPGMARKRPLGVRRPSRGTVAGP